MRLTRSIIVTDHCEAVERSTSYSIVKGAFEELLPEVRVLKQSSTAAAHANIETPERVALRDALMGVLQMYESPRSWQTKLICGRRTAQLFPAADLRRKLRRVQDTLAGLPAQEKALRSQQAAQAAHVKTRQEALQAERDLAVLLYKQRQVVRERAVIRDEFYRQDPIGFKAREVKAAQVAHDPGQFIGELMPGVAPLDLTLRAATAVDLGPRPSLPKGHHAYRKPLPATAQQAAETHRR